MAGTSVFFVGTVVTNGVPLPGTLTIKSTTTSAGVATTTSSSGEFSVKINVAYGDTITFSFDSGQATTATQVLAVQPAAGQALPVYWDTATKVVTGLGVEP